VKSTEVCCLSLSGIGTDCNRLRLASVKGLRLWQEVQIVYIVKLIMYLADRDSAVSGRNSV